MPPTHEDVTIARPPDPEWQPRRAAPEEPSGASDNSTGGRTRRPQTAASFLLELVAILVVGLLITTGLRAFVFQPFEVPSGSMENTLQVHDKIVALRVLDFKRGDVVVFEDTNGWLGEQPEPGPIRRGLEFVGVLPSSAEGHLVKRVVGLPGDRVSCCDAEGRLTVNGGALDESEYLYSDASGSIAPAEVPFEVVVPEGRIFVLGDHRNASGDSRCHLQDVSLEGGPTGLPAFIPEDSVVGTVSLIITPLSRFQQLKTPGAYAGVPEPLGPAPAQPEMVRVHEGC